MLGKPNTNPARRNIHLYIITLQAVNFVEHLQIIFLTSLRPAAALTLDRTADFSFIGRCGWNLVLDHSTATLYKLSEHVHHVSFSRSC